MFCFIFINFIDCNISSNSSSSKMSKNEAKIYETILEIWECGVSEISKKSQIHRRSIYNALQRLVEKWIIFQIFWWKENLFSAAAPQKLLEIIKEKEEWFLKVLPYLEKLKNKNPSEEDSFVYKWIEWYKNYLRDRIRVAEDTFFLWAKWNWVTPWISIAFEQNFKKALEKNWKKLKIIFDPRVKNREDILNTASWEYRFLPDWFETPGIVDIFWDYVITFNAEGIWNFWEKGSIFVMRNKDLANSYRKWFEFIRERC